MKTQKDYYGEIANHINNMIPIEWKTVYYLGEVEKEKKSWSSVFFFVDMKGRTIKSHLIPEEFNVSESIYYDLLNELNDILLEFYDETLSEGQDAWEQFSMTVKNTGEFHVDYSYDAISSTDFSQLKREVIWAYTTFGRLPNSDHLKKELKEYLETSKNE